MTDRKGRIADSRSQPIKPISSTLRGQSAVYEAHAWDRKRLAQGQFLSPGRLLNRHYYNRRVVNFLALYLDCGKKHG